MAVPPPRLAAAGETRQGLFGPDVRRRLPGPGGHRRDLPERPEGRRADQGQGVGFLTDRHLTARGSRGPRTVFSVRGLPNRAEGSAGLHTHDFINYPYGEESPEGQENLQSSSGPHRSGPKDVQGQNRN